MKISARFLVIGLLSLFFGLFFLASSSFAQTNYVTPNTNPDVPNNLHTWTQNVMIEVTSSLSCLIAGIDPNDRSQRCLGFDTKTGKIGYIQKGGGAIGAMGNLITMTFTPPAHTSDFVRYLSSNFGIAKPVQAQGVGFTRLTPLISVWTAFRNIVYLLFVLVFIAIGFAIMFRVHIDPRTVMTIENQIPKIIVALILVTFSFAIAGFLIDFMYVFIYLSIELFRGIPGNKDVLSSFGQIQGQNPFQVATSAFGNIQNIPTQAAGGAKDIVQGLLHVSQNNDNLIDIPVLTGIVSGVLKTIDTVTNFAGWLTGVLVGGIALLVIEIALLFALFRLWFQLIMAYVFILMDIVFAPFWIIAGLIPGAGLSFSAWFRHILAYIAAFPATVIIFLLGTTFFNGFGKDGMAFVPPLIGNPGNNNSALGSLIALGIILTAPNIVTMMISALKAPKLDLTPVGQAIGVGTSAITSGIGAVGAARMSLPKPGEKGGFGEVFRRFMR